MNTKKSTKPAKEKDSLNKETLHGGNSNKKMKVKSSKAVINKTGKKLKDEMNDSGYMNPKQLDYFRSLLLRWKIQIMEEVDNTKNNMQREMVNYPDIVDRANHEEEFNLELRARDRERKLIYKIDDALNRINDGDYGYCDACGAEIGIKRLEARPTATQCIECKKIAEIKEKQSGESSLEQF